MQSTEPIEKIEKTEIMPSEKSSLIGKEATSKISPSQIKRLLDPSQATMILLPGYSWNPLLKLEPNRKCPCQSGLRFKKCCRDKLQRAVPKKQAEQLKKQMLLPDLVFVTENNKKQLEEIAREQITDEKSNSRT